jgi:hypothetical protein
MTPTLIRGFWAFVEMTQSSILLGLDDVALTQWLVGNFTHEQHLSNNQASWLQDYIATRLNLIRELAGQRAGLYHLSA